MNTQIKSVLIALLLATLISCCVNKKPIVIDKVYLNEVAFIELIQTQNGEIISGTAQEGRRIDGPTYEFDKTSKQLTILRKDNFYTDSVKAFLGNVIILQGTAGSGLSMRINAIKKFPYSMGNLTIKKVDNNEVSIIFDKKELLLKEGIEWETSSTKIDTIKTESISIIKNTTKYSIIYHGMIDKSNIK